MTVISAPGCPPRLTRATTRACTDARLPHMKYAPPQRALGARGQFLRASVSHACTLLSWVIYPESNIRLLIDLLIYVSCLFYAVCPRHLRILSHLSSPTHPPNDSRSTSPCLVHKHSLSVTAKPRRTGYRLHTYPRGHPPEPPPPCKARACPCRYTRRCLWALIRQGGKISTDTSRCVLRRRDECAVAGVGLRFACWCSRG